MKKTVKWILVAAAGILVLICIGLSIMAGSPKDALQMVRYALPYMRVGDLKVGDSARDVQLVALDGRTRFRLREHLSGRPLVLVFGSFT